MPAIALTKERTLPTPVAGLTAIGFCQPASIPAVIWRGSQDSLRSHKPAAHLEAAPLGSGLREDLDHHALHVCVDMQKLFAPGSPWHVPWTMDVLPAVTDIARRHPARTLFTRFIPARKAGGGPGVWRKYYEKWSQVTLVRIPIGTGRHSDVKPATIPI